MTNFRTSDDQVPAGVLRNAIINCTSFLNIAINHQGVIQLFNLGAERMLGYAASDVLHKMTAADFCDPEELHARAAALTSELKTPITPDAKALIAKAARGLDDSVELTQIRKDGSRFSMMVSVTALRNTENVIIGYLLLGVENDARKQAEDKLRWAEESFRLMVESVTDYAIAMLDPQGQVVSWNAGVERIQGYQAEQVIGQHFSKFYPSEDIIDGKPQGDLDEAKAKGRYEDEGWRVRKDKSQFWANVVLSAIRDHTGALRGFAILTRDLTERRQVEAALTAAKSAAEKANLAKSGFLSSMSHELRSPLNAILGFAQLLETDSPPPTAGQSKSIDQILQAGWYLLDLINEILDLAVIESGKLSLSLEPVSLVEVSAECQSIVESQARKRGIRITYPSFASPLFVNADRIRIKQVMINLLSNAIKYNREHGEVKVECVASSPRRVRINIQDSGAGIPETRLGELFQPFNRLGKEGGVEQGTGIGLVVCKRLVELMGGSIGVESTPGIGSVFWVELNRQDPPILIGEEGQSAAQLAPSAKRMRTLLYVEDNPANLQLIEQLIARRTDLRFLSAEDGNLGVQMALTALPDVILMDINLPGISGIEALKILRENPTTAHIPVVALSANAIPRDIKNGLSQGFFRYLTKPIKVNEFLDTLNEVLEFVESTAHR